MGNGGSSSNQNTTFQCEILERTDRSLHIRLSGVIVDSIDFPSLLGDVNTELKVSCSEVRRINSVGVMSWIRYFTSLSNRNVNLVFAEVSVALVEQIGLIKNFLGGGKLESMCIQFFCPSCSGDFAKNFQLSELRNMLIDPPAPECPNCKSPRTVIDDIPDSLFGIVSTR